MVKRCLSLKNLLCFLVGLVLVLPSSASGMTVLAADLPDLVRDSQTIVHGVVTQVENVVLNEKDVRVTEEVLRRLSADDRPTGLRAFTDVTLHILESYKGEHSPGQTIQMRLVGGQMGPFTLSIPGMPGFQVKSEVFLFLHKTALGFTPVGAGQGVFRIQRRGPNGATAVHDMKGMAVIRHQAVPAECGKNTVADGACAPQMTAGAPAIPDEMPLQSLDAQVRALQGLPPAKGLRMAPASFPKQR